MLNCMEDILHGNLVALLNLADEAEEPFDKSLLNVDAFRDRFDQILMRISRKIECNLILRCDDTT